jgi:RNA-binding signal recognition particle 68
MSSSKQPLLRIFDTITAAQDVHGNVIRQPDNFRRYRIYCTNKMDRLRHHRDARSALVHNPKFPGATVVVTNAKPKQHRHAYGHRPTLLSQYQPIEHETEAAMAIGSSNTISPPQNLYYLLLFQAERAWAMACELQQGKKRVKTPHGHVQRRLNKAVQHAQQLLTLVETQQQQLDPTIDAVTVQECRAYLQWCQGNAALEHAAAANALDVCRLEAHRSYRQAHYALQRLVATADSSSWRYFSNHVLFPLVRYAKHEARNLLEPEDEAAEQEQAAFLAQHASSTSSTTVADTTATSSSWSFRGHTISPGAVLPTFPALYVAYLKLEKILLPVENDDETKPGLSTPPLAEPDFVQLLADLEDLLKLIRQAVGSKKGFVAELGALAGLVQGQQLSLWRRQEARLLQDVGATCLLTPDVPVLERLAHTYDALWQNIQQTVNLYAKGPTAVLDEAAAGAAADYILDEDVGYLLAQAQLLRIRTMRCFYLACLHSHLAGQALHQPANDDDGGVTSVRRVLSSLWLLLHVTKKRLGRNAACSSDETTSTEMALVPEYEQQLQAVGPLVRQLQSRLEMTLYLLQSLPPDQRALRTNRPLWIRLHERDGGTVLADSPDLLPMPMPCKPVFYDLAGQMLLESPDIKQMVLQEFQAYLASH